MGVLKSPRGKRPNCKPQPLLLSTENSKAQREGEVIPTAVQYLNVFVCGFSARLLMVVWLSAWCRGEHAVALYASGAYRHITAIFIAAYLVDDLRCNCGELRWAPLSTLEPLKAPRLETGQLLLECQSGWAPGAESCHQ